MTQAIAMVETSLARAPAALSFPLIGASIAAFAQSSKGPQAGVEVMRGMATALIADAALPAYRSSPPSAWRRRAASSRKGRRSGWFAARDKQKTRPRGDRSSPVRG